MIFTCIFLKLLFLHRSRDDVLLSLGHVCDFENDENEETVFRKGDKEDNSKSPELLSTTTTKLTTMSTNPTTTISAESPYKPTHFSSYDTRSSPSSTLSGVKSSGGVDPSSTNDIFKLVPLTYCSWEK